MRIHVELGGDGGRTVVAIQCVTPEGIICVEGVTDLDRRTGDGRFDHTFGVGRTGGAMGLGPVVRRLMLDMKHRGWLQLGEGRVQFVLDGQDFAASGLMERLDRLSSLAHALEHEPQDLGYIAVNDPSATVRLCSLVALAEVDVAAARTAATALVDDADPDVLVEVCGLLSRPDPLRATVAEWRHPLVRRKRAVAWLATLDPLSLRAAVAEAPELWLPAFAIWSGPLDEWLDFTASHADHPEGRELVRAVLARMVEAPTERGAAWLRDALEADLPPLREPLVAAAGRIGGVEHVPALRALEGRLGLLDQRLILGVGQAIRRIQRRAGGASGALSLPETSGGELMLVEAEAEERA